MSALCLVLVTTCLAEPPKAASSSDAERIARLQRSIEEGDKQLAAIKKQLDDPAGEYFKAQADFKAIDERRAQTARERDRLRKEKQKAEADALDAELKTLQTRWQRARDRFDLALEERKTLQAKAASLPGKIEPERRVLERLLGTSSAPPAEKKPEKTDKPAQPVKVEKPPEPAKKPETPSKPVKTNRHLDKARELVRFKEEAAEKARDKVKNINEYLDQLKRQIELEERLLETARKKLALARAAQADLEDDQHKRVGVNAPEAEIQKGWEDINAAVQRIDDATHDERDITDRLTELHAQLTRVQGFQITALKTADETGQEATSALAKLRELENPFHPRNLAQWFVDHGVRAGAISFGMIALYVLVRTGTRRIVRVMARKRMSGGRESEDRAETLVGVLRNTLSVFILAGGVLMLLDEVGIPVVPLLGGAAVLGLAVAFGAQNLIKDYFTGFMVLMEDQYAVNDVVQIDNLEGKVERITLRMTVLRDLAGVAHFIPHGAITTVSNMSHGWARANLEIGVGYKEDPDRVLEVLRALCAELRRDAHYGGLILEDAEMLGVDQLADSSVILKFVVKTKPMKQWEVKRELLRRIKNRFDQLGIEIPFPHRTVYHHKDVAAATPRLAA